MVEEEAVEVSSIWVGPEQPALQSLVARQVLEPQQKSGPQHDGPGSLAARFQLGAQKVRSFPDKQNDRVLPSKDRPDGRQ